MVSCPSGNQSASSENIPVGTGNSYVLEKLLDECLLDEDDIDIDVYLDIWRELCGFITKWGRLFKFVVDDVTTKINGIAALRAAHPNKTGTLMDLTAWEHSKGIMREYEPKSGTVNILVLHRAMEFVVKLIDGVYENEDDYAKVSVIGREAYDSTLSKHHSWFVRKLVGAAMVTLPYRKDFIADLRGPMPASEDGRFYQHFDETTRDIQQRVSAVLDEYDMTNFSKHS